MPYWASKRVCHRYLGKVKFFGVNWITKRCQKCNFSSVQVFKVPPASCRVNSSQQLQRCMFIQEIWEFVLILCFDTMSQGVLETLEWTGSNPPLVGCWQPWIILTTQDQFLTTLDRFLTTQILRGVRFLTTLDRFLTIHNFRGSGSWHPWVA